MNKKIALSMLILCIIYILGYYILKFIFPEQLLLVVTDVNILRFGNWLNSWAGYLYICQTISTMITYYLFVCACSGRFKLKWFEFIYIILASVLCKIISLYAPDYYVHTSTVCMLMLSCLCKGKLLNTTITFGIHGYLQQFLFTIRGFETIIAKINYASAIVLTIECWVWLLLLGLIFYLKGGKNGLVPTISEQDGAKETKRTRKSSKGDIKG